MANIAKTDPEQVWTHVWQNHFSDEENWLDIEREQKSIRWKKIKKLVLEKYDSFSGLETIEIGAGRGTYSLLMSLESARASLLDNNEQAFLRAKEFFHSWSKEFTPVLSDAFRLPNHLTGRFDIAMSYGFAEHFVGSERTEVFKAHMQLLKSGGLLVLSVPNRFFLPYRLGKWTLEAFNKWEFGLEIPFSRSELLNIAKTIGLKNVQVIGSGVIEDTCNFWLTQRLIHCPVYFWDRFISPISNRKAGLVPLKSRSFYFPYHPETPLDDWLGYALILVGEKP